jgi:hypothetical protein
MSDIALHKSRKLSKDQKLHETTRLSRAYRAWQREQLAEALTGAHGAMVAELMAVLDRLELNSAAILLAAVQRTDWHDVDPNTRFTVLHQINETISRLRERNSMPAIDDPLPDQPDNVFRRIKKLMFVAPPGARSGSNQMKP